MVASFIVLEGVDLALEVAGLLFLGVDKWSSWFAPLLPLMVW